MSEIVKRIKTERLIRYLDNSYKKLDELLQQDIRGYTKRERDIRNAIIDKLYELINLYTNELRSRKD